MALSKQLENGASIVLLYAKKFDWKKKKESKLLGGEPTTGRVYRALKDPSTNAYYVKVDHDVKSSPRIEGVRLTKLAYDTPEWDCDMVEITDDNIIELDITTEDYKKINQWVEEDYKDFVSHLEEQQGLDVMASQTDDFKSDPSFDVSDRKPLMDDEVRNKIKDALSGIIPTGKYNNDLLGYLSMRDPWIVQSLEMLLFHIKDQIDEEDSGPTISISREIAMSDDLGKGANIYSALYSIEQYMNKNQEIGGDAASLLHAIYALVLELTRLNIKN